MAATPRVIQVQEALASWGLDGFVCALPMNVLMLSGYWPVIGTVLAIADSSGKISLLVPKDELALAKTGWAYHVSSFDPARSSSAAQSAAEPLMDLLRGSALSGPRLGCERGDTTVPAPYVGLHLYGNSLDLPGFNLIGADEALADLRSTLSEIELERTALACNAAATIFERALHHLRPGANEACVAAQLIAEYVCASPELCEHGRAGAAVFCMSGPNAAEAFAAFQRSRARRLARGDLVLLHCNSYVDGYWTDITRTYCLSTPDTQQQRMYNAIFAARDAALKAIRPGTTGDEVDTAARRTISEHGFDGKFKHPTGHGVGFAAIDHNARPRLHPGSSDVLREGMVFNIEPGLYLDGEAGMRHCDMVVVTADGAKVLTPFHTSLKDLVIA